MSKTTPEQIREAYSKLPEPVRAYLADGAELNRVLIDLGKTYHLHIYVSGIVGEEIGNLLLGLIDSKEFVSRLRAVGISNEAVTGIVNDINQKIFIPLHDKMRQGGEEDPAQVAPAQPPPARAPLPEPPHTPPPSAPVAPRLAQAPFVPPERPEPPQPPQPPRPVQPPAPAVSTSAPPSMPTPPIQNPPSAVLPPRHVLPNQNLSFARPVPPAPPANLPTGSPPIAPPPSGAGPGAPHTRYPNDPYREPIE